MKRIIKSFIILAVLAFCTFDTAHAEEPASTFDTAAALPAVEGVEKTTLKTIIQPEQLIRSIEANEPLSLNIEVSAPVAGEGFGTWLGKNWVSFAAIMFFLLEIILRYTPSERDNSILSFIKGLFDRLFPNKSTQGFHK